MCQLLYAYARDAERQLQCQSVYNNLLLLQFQINNMLSYHEYRASGNLKVTFPKITSETLYALQLDLIDTLEQQLFISLLVFRTLVNTNNYCLGNSTDYVMNMVFQSRILYSKRIPNRKFRFLAFAGYVQKTQTTILLIYFYY